MESVFEQDEEKLMELSQNEEYLEDEEAVSSTEDMIDEDKDTFKIKEEPTFALNDALTFSYACDECEKTFRTRSGRDTHVQLKHKIPDDLVFDIDSHAVEIELESGMSITIPF
jgi:hypothetical protein